MTRAELLFLGNEMQHGSLRERPLHLISAVADDHRGAGGKERRGGPENSLDERQAADFVQDFWQLGLHPGALASGQNNDVYVTQGLGIQTPMLV